MNSQPSRDPFSPMSAWRLFRWLGIYAVLLIVYSFLLGGMEGGFSRWHVFKIGSLIGSIAALGIGVLNWLLSGRRGMGTFGSARIPAPSVRFQKAIPGFVIIMAI